MDDNTTTLADLKRHMAAFVAARDWEQFHRPKNLAMSIAIEAAELMEHFQWVDHDQADALVTDPAVKAEMADEMADVFAYLLSLANAIDVDLAVAYEAKMRKNEAKYPADQVRGCYDRPADDR